MKFSPIVTKRVLIEYGGWIILAGKATNRYVTRNRSPAIFEKEFETLKEGFESNPGACNIN